MMPILARTAMAGSGAFVVLLSMLHAVKPEIDPSWTVISAYALGDYGWLMTVAFAAMAVGCLALAMLLRVDARSIIGRIGLGALVISAAGFALAAVFPTDPITIAPDQQTWSGQLHSAGAMLGGAIPVAAIALSWTLARHPDWERAKGWLWSATVAAWIGDIVFMVALTTMLPRGGGSLGPAVLIGWPNRLMVVTFCSWVFIAAWQAARLRAR